MATFYTMTARSRGRYFLFSNPCHRQEELCADVRVTNSQLLRPLAFTAAFLPPQLAATCNIEQSFFNDWFTGHLNFQIEHQWVWTQYCLVITGCHNTGLVARDSLLKTHVWDGTESQRSPGWKGSQKQSGPNFHGKSRAYTRLPNTFSCQTFHFHFPLGALPRSKQRQSQTTGGCCLYRHSIFLSCYPVLQLSLSQF